MADTLVLGGSGDLVLDLCLKVKHAQATTKSSTLFVCCLWLVSHKARLPHNHSDFFSP